MECLRKDELAFSRKINRGAHSKRETDIYLDCREELIELLILPLEKKIIFSQDIMITSNKIARTPRLCKT